METTAGHFVDESTTKRREDESQRKRECPLLDALELKTQMAPKRWNPVEGKIAPSIFSTLILEWRNRERSDFASQMCTRNICQVVIEKSKVLELSLHYLFLACGVIYLFPFCKPLNYLLNGFPIGEY